MNLSGTFGTFNFLLFAFVAVTMSCRNRVESTHSGLALDARRVALGRGYDSIRDDVTNSCVVYSGGSVTTPFQNLSSNFEFRVVQTQEDLKQELNMEADAKADFKVVSVGAKASFFESIKTSTFHLYGVVKKVYQRDYPKVFGDAALSAFALESLRQSPDGRPFQRDCGDSYIEYMVGGGEFYGVLSISANSQEIVDKYAAELSASFIGIGSGSGSFEKTVSRIASESELYITIYSIGSDIVVPVCGKDANCLLGAANNFNSSMENQAGTLIRIGTVGYDQIHVPEDVRPALQKVRSRSDEFQLMSREIDGRRISLTFLKREQQLWDQQYFKSCREYCAKVYPGGFPPLERMKCIREGRNMGSECELNNPVQFPATSEQNFFSVIRACQNSNIEEVQKEIKTCLETYVCKHEQRSNCSPI